MHDASLPRPAVTIVLPHREAFGPGRAGAVATIVRRFATDGSRYDVTVIGSRTAGPVFPDIRFRPVDTPRWLPLSPTHAYALAVARLLAAQPPTQIEVHNKPDVAALLARLFPRRPVSLFLHNDPRTMRGARTPRARQRLLERLAATVTVSSYISGALLDGLTSPARTPLILPNSIPPAELPPITPMAARDPVLLFAGRVVPDKAPDAFVAACALALPRLPGWRAEIIGADGFGADVVDSNYVRDLRPQAAAANVTLVGYQPHPAVLRAMARAAIVVVPSRWPEPFGLTALEAMACGAALVCSQRGGLPEVTGPCCIPMNPDDIPAFADALVRLASDETLRATLSQDGQRRAAHQFGSAAAITVLDGLRDAVAARATPAMIS